MTFGDVLRNLLEEKDITQRELAHDLNIATSTLGNYVRNYREPDFETLKRFADYFDVTIDYLLDYPTKQKNAQSHSEMEVLRIYRNLSPRHQALFLDQGKLLMKYQRAEKTDN